MVRGLLTVDCPANPAPTQPTEPAPSPGQTPQPVSEETQSASPQPPSETDAQTVPAEATPLENAAQPIDIGTLPQLTQLSAGVGVNYQFPDSRGQSYHASALGANSGAPIQATQQGWRILGLAWYWWLGVILIISALYMGGKRLAQQSSLGVVKQ